MKNCPSSTAWAVAGLILAACASARKVAEPSTAQPRGEPVYVVDGAILPGFSMADVDTLDLERIEVIKGDSAVALYGERAANGVVVITTRREGAVLLRLAPPVGQVSHYRVVAEITGQPEGDRPFSMLQTFYMTNTVLEADGDLRQIEAVFDLVRIEPLTDATRATADALTALRWTETVTTSGKTLSMEFDYSSVPAEFRAQMTTMQETLTGFSVEMSEEPVRPGATWTVPVVRSQTLGMATIKATRELTYRFERLDVRNGARHAIISATGTVTVETALDSAGVEIRVNYEGPMVGEFDFDLDAGRMVSASITMELEGATVIRSQVLNERKQMVLTTKVDQRLVDASVAVAAELLAAASEGSVDTVRDLLDKGVDPDARGEHGKTALMAAARQGHSDIVNLLLERDADVHAKDRDGRTALREAAYSGHADLVNALLAHGAEVDAKDDVLGGTALMDAAFIGYADVVNALLQRGAEVNAKLDMDGSTALMAASSGGHAHVVNALLAHGAEVNAKDDDGETALVAAAERGHADVVNALLEGGAEVNVKDAEGRPPLGLAAFGGHADVVKALLEGGAEVNAEAAEGRTALTAAAGQGHADVVNALLEGGAEVNAEAAEGRSALMIAASQGHADVVKALLEGGAEVNAEGREGMTALRFAVFGGHADVVKALLEGGAEVNAEGPAGMSALMLAAGQGHGDVVNALLEGGADVNATDDAGRTAIMYAVRFGHTEVVNALLAKGARRP